MHETWFFRSPSYWGAFIPFQCFLMLGGGAIHSSLFTHIERHMLFPVFDDQWIDWWQYHSLVLIWTLRCNVALHCMVDSVYSLHQHLTCWARWKVSRSFMGNIQAPPTHFSFMYICTHQLFWSFFIALQFHLVGTEDMYLLYLCAEYSFLMPLRSSAHAYIIIIRCLHS